MPISAVKFRLSVCAQRVPSTVPMSSSRTKKTKGLMGRANEPLSSQRDGSPLFAQVRQRCYRLSGCEQRSTMDIVRTIGTFGGDAATCRGLKVFP